MITKFKIYEAVNQGEPEVGDYVIAEAKCKQEYSDMETCNLIINNKIGKLVDIEYNRNFDPSPFKVKYDIIFGYDWDEDKLEIIKVDYLWFKKYEILYWSKNIEELESMSAQERITARIDRYSRIGVYDVLTEKEV